MAPIGEEKWWKMCKDSEGNSSGRWWIGLLSSLDGSRTIKIDLNPRSVDLDPEMHIYNYQSQLITDRFGYKYNS